MNEEKNTEEKVNGKQLFMVALIAVIALLAFVAVYFAAGGYLNKGNDIAAVPTPTATTAASGITETAAPSATAPTTALQSSPAPKATEGSGAATTTAKPKLAPNTKYNLEQAMKMAQTVAKTQFGDDAVVLPLSEEGVATMINIDGKERAIFIFGADSMSKMVGSNSSMRGLYHFDANTGEVFDNASGTMVKVN